MKRKKKIKTAYRVDWEGGIRPVLCFGMRCHGVTGPQDQWVNLFGATEVIERSGMDLDGRPIVYLHVGRRIEGLYETLDDAKAAAVYRMKRSLTRSVSGAKDLRDRIKAMKKKSWKP